MQVLAGLVMALSLFPTLSQAQVFLGPLSSALGGTGRAGLDSTEGSFLNPALIPLMKGHEVDGYFADGSVSPDNHQHAWGFGAADNSPGLLFPGALQYIRLRTTGLAAVPVDGELWHLGIGQQVFDWLSFGISAYRLDYKMAGAPDSVQWNGSAGFLWTISRDIGVAYVLNNIFHADDGIPASLRQNMQQGVGFLASVFEIARLRLDVTRNESNNPDRKMVYMAGFEQMFGPMFLLRVGYHCDDQAGQNFVTLGLGFDGPRLKIDYALQKDLRGDSGAMHSVDFRLAF